MSEATDPHILTVEITGASPYLRRELVVLLRRWITASDNWRYAGMDGERGNTFQVRYVSR